MCTIYALIIIYVCTNNNLYACVYAYTCMYFINIYVRAYVHISSLCYMHYIMYVPIYVRILHVCLCTHTMAYICT